MSDVPATIQVGPFPYRVLATGAAMGESRYRSESPCRVGEIAFRSLTITLDPLAPIARLRETLLHEVLHGIIDAVDRGEKCPKTWEEVVTCLAPLLLDTLRRNPALIAFLTETETS